MVLRKNIVIIIKILIIYSKSYNNSISDKFIKFFIDCIFYVFIISQNIIIVM